MTIPEFTAICFVSILGTVTVYRWVQIEFDKLKAARHAANLRAVELESELAAMAMSHNLEDGFSQNQDEMLERLAGVENKLALYGSHNQVLEGRIDRNETRATFYTNRFFERFAQTDGNLEIAQVALAQLTARVAKLEKGTKK